MSDFSTDQTATDTSTDQLTFKVGERDYDAASATTKIEAADAHIAKLEAEAKVKEEQLAAANLKLATTDSVEEALSKLQTANTPDTQTTPSTEGMSEDQIRDIANQKVQDILNQDKEQQAKEALETQAKETFAKTKEALSNQFGDKTEETMKSLATSKGITMDALVKLASDPTTAGFLLDSLKVSQSPSQASPSASFNTASLDSNAPEGNKDWYKGSSTDIMKELTRQLQNA